MKFTESHEWILISNGIGIVGITKHAQKELGEIVYLELPELGAKVLRGMELVVLESTKAAVDIYTPVSGEILEVNKSLKLDIELLNRDPEKEGWLFKIKLTDPEEVKTLLHASEYLALIS